MPKSAEPKRHLAIDQLLDGVALINTAWLALQDQEWIDESALHDLATTLGIALKTLEPVRKALDGSGLEI